MGFLSRVYWDTMMFVYWHEYIADFTKRVRGIYKRMVERDDELHTSFFTLGELLTGAYNAGDPALAGRIRTARNSENVHLLEFDLHAAEEYGKIRSATKAKPADAIHLACAASHGIDLFLTNDRALHGLIVPGIQFIGGLNVNVL